MLRSVVLLVLCALATCAPYQPTFDPLEPDQLEIQLFALHEKLLDGIVRISTLGGNGTGFAVAEDEAGTLILTCAHVVDTDLAPWIIVYQDIVADMRTGIVIWRDLQLDLALVRVAARGFYPVFEIMSANDYYELPIRTYEIDGGIKHSGELLFTGGFPTENRPALLTWGFLLSQSVSVWRGGWGGHHNASGWYGFSGGPVVDRFGQVVGVNAQIFDDMSDQMWMIPAPKIESFLERAGVSP